MPRCANGVRFRAGLRPPTRCSEAASRCSTSREGRASAPACSATTPNCSPTGSLLIVGELDRVCGPAHARPIIDAVADVKLVSIPDCGHVVPAEAPEAFREAVLSFTH